ncbi:TetR/AcrR family transcriptional regulator [Marinitenerispora sediminis]|uniref:TetR/AcrR family transcriptional regulator n=1 Tax=Marinitenerispora sediminis TaxID=1931232 RepID=UPI0013147DBB|nr:TetR/AcrR family transcriptional regulator [Marinitenerispora sediminis]
MATLPAADPPAPARPERDGPVRRRLLAAASALFARRGFERTSLRDVAEAAHVSEAVLRRHFGDTDALLDAICVRAARAEAGRLERIAAAPRPVAERVRAAAADAVVAAICDPDDDAAVYRAHSPAVADRRREVRAARHRYQVLFRALIAEGQGSGAFSAQVPPDTVVDFFLGSVHHLSTWYRPANRRSAAEVGDYYAGQLVDALRPVPMSA